MSTKTPRHPHHRHKNQTNVVDAGERHAENIAPADTKDRHDRRVGLIRVRAYGLWEQAGKPNDDGSRERFWLEAEKAFTSPWPVLHG